MNFHKGRESLLQILTTECAVWHLTSFFLFLCQGCDTNGSAGSRKDDEDRQQRERKEGGGEGEGNKTEEGRRRGESSISQFKAWLGYMHSCHVTALSWTILCLQEVSWRSRIASLQKSDLLGLTQPAGTPRPQTSDKRGTDQPLQAFFLWQNL